MDREPPAVSSGAAWPLHPVPSYRATPAAGPARRCVRPPDVSPDSGMPTGSLRVACGLLRASIIRRSRPWGGAVKIRVWLVTRERSAWIAAAEIVAMFVLLTLAVESALVQLLGFGLLAHVGYTAVTGLPMGQVPGRPPGGHPRRNLDLRAQVVGFLREVRRVDEYAQRARVSGLPADQVEASLRAGEQRLLAAAVKVARVTRRPSAHPPSAKA